MHGDQKTFLEHYAMAQVSTMFVANDTKLQFLESLRASLVSCEVVKNKVIH